ncbi:hypothetical protein [Photobacterium sp. TY1-4]|uniref:hypothetical protein n=1 Tax=Photobacterium sp. TY1-4 TaxID=2899122 RepID=UPI0021BE177E|nr:hypothetical protein [Photobacterium sp. TY1-4]UXI04729.1 hypothetical protein NH461_25600 [Photobacterium sp. TY1-4]
MYIVRAKTPVTCAAIIDNDPALPDYIAPFVRYVFEIGEACYFADDNDRKREQVLAGPFETKWVTMPSENENVTIWRREAPEDVWINFSSVLKYPEQSPGNFTFKPDL